MLLIHCPYCGPRPEHEFHNGQDAHKTRPTNSAFASDPASEQESSSAEVPGDADWADYLYMKAPVKGWYYERWVHTAGCRRWFNALRHTVTNEVAATYAPDAPKPPLPEESRP